MKLLRRIFARIKTAFTPPPAWKLNYTHNTIVLGIEGHSYNALYVDLHRRCQEVDPRMPALGKVRCPRMVARRPAGLNWQGRPYIDTPIGPALAYYTYGSGTIHYADGAGFAEGLQPGLYEHEALHHLLYEVHPKKLRDHPKEYFKLAESWRD